MNSVNSVHYRQQLANNNNLNIQKTKEAEKPPPMIRVTNLRGNHKDSQDEIRIESPVTLSYRKQQDNNDA